MVEKIKHFVDEFINPALAMHDGRLTVQSLDNEGILYVTLSGGCQGCASVKATLQGQVAAYLTEEFPEVVGIVDLTEHDNAENPYYRK
tara:strand:+ start:245 stop:508 length:264 start_codon:yes stop_codon:yes gene_type:complete